MKVGTDSLSQFTSRQEPGRLDHCSFAMDPSRFNRIEPRTLFGQEQRQDPPSCTSLFDVPIVFSAPGYHQLAFVPGGVIPNQEPVLLAFFCQSLAAPLEKLHADHADRSSSDKAQPHLLPNVLQGRACLPEHSVAGIWVALLPSLLNQPQWGILTLPGRQSGTSEARPPHFISKPNGPARLLTGPTDQPISCGFFLGYSGSGLLIQCLTRFQLYPNREMACRIVSPLTGSLMRPCSKQTWAKRGKLQRWWSLPKSSGRRCIKASSLSFCWSRWGRREPACKTERPSRLKPLITLRTVWSSQPTCWAITPARSPRALPSRIWHLRNTKASLECRPALIC